LCGLPGAAGLSAAGGKGEMILTSGMIVPTSLANFVQAAQPSGSLLGNPLLLMIPFIAVFYFLMIRPAQNRQKKVNEMLKNLKNGDKVITNGGIYGTIVGLEGDAIQLRIADQVKIKVSRSAVAGLQLESKES
jgi:preprotein translocase subunit YajC